MFACLHEVISSFRLFREANSGLENSKVLPQRHRLHRFEALLSRGGWRGGGLLSRGGWRGGVWVASLLKNPSDFEIYVIVSQVPDMSI